ncbi:MAG: multiprotein bridging factor aMBF1 [Desulfurococcales archaeon]|nr:multiprotein bridging factor aMBF1 [Desulfurococcales archaeon]
MARSPKEILYCEVCGQPIHGPVYRAEVDGVEMNLCPSCYVKLSRSGRAVLIRSRKPKAGVKKRPQPPRRTSRILEALELVEDYYERIRQARTSLGWTQAALAQRLRISESMLRKIESGKMKPSIDLAKKMERILKIKLLEPVEIEEEEDFTAPPGTLTLGDIVIVRRDEE